MTCTHAQKNDPLADLHKQALCHWSAENRDVFVPSFVGPNRHGGLITKEIDGVHSGVAQHWIVGSELTLAWFLFFLPSPCSLPSVFFLLFLFLGRHNNSPPQCVLICSCPACVMLISCLVWPLVQDTIFILLPVQQSPYTIGQSFCMTPTKGASMDSPWLTSSY